VHLLTWKPKKERRKKLASVESQKCVLSPPLVLLQDKETGPLRATGAVQLQRKFQFGAEFLPPPFYAPDTESGVLRDPKAAFFVPNTKNLSTLESILAQFTFIVAHFDSLHIALFASGP
jgi:hypothetical protein